MRNVREELPERLGIIIGGRTICDMLMISNYLRRQKLMGEALTRQCGAWTTYKHIKDSRDGAYTYTCTTP